MFSILFDQLFVMSDICVQKVNELSQHQMIWTDEDGFLLKPLGIMAYNAVAGCTP